MTDSKERLKLCRLLVQFDDFASTPEVVRCWQRSTTYYTKCTITTRSNNMALLHPKRGTSWFIWNIHTLHVLCTRPDFVAFHFFQSFRARRQRTLFLYSQATRRLEMSYKYAHRPVCSLRSFVSLLGAFRTAWRGRYSYLLSPPKRRSR